MDDTQTAALLCAKELIARQLPEGGWPFHSGAAQAAVEPTALALLALPRTLVRERASATHFLLQLQNRNGSWPAFSGDTEGSGLTGLAIYGLRHSGVEGIAINRAIHWLLQFRGRESHWLWKWKFRTTDRHVRFDPDKSGWPWAPGSVSWVVPTSYSLLALNDGRGVSAGRELARFRIQRGVEMLYDRSCPQGGWNAGNGVVYGMELVAHPDATAIALLALRKTPMTDALTRSLAWLERRVQFCAAPWSLAWAIVALRGFQRDTRALIRRLAAFVQPGTIDDCATLAIVFLALDSIDGLKGFGAMVAV